MRRTTLFKESMQTRRIECILMSISRSAFGGYERITFDRNDLTYLVQTASSGGNCKYLHCISLGEVILANTVKELVEEIIDKH